MSAPTKAFFQPAEWADHEGCYLAWPSDEDLWQDRLHSAQKEFTDLCETIGASEKILLLTPHSKARNQAKSALHAADVSYLEVPFGDIWLRDTAPIFLKAQDSSLERKAASFAFNGWGEKYILPHDADLSERLAENSGLPTERFDFVLEGGSVEVDGEGTLLTTEQCLLNPNRNPWLPRGLLEAQLSASLGVKKVLWIKEGLLNDHTDGHIDTIARFIAPGRVVCMKAVGRSDPNREILEAIEAQLRDMSDAQGRRLEVITIPSPGEVLSDYKKLMPASYVNFYISNAHVIVPQYGSAFDAAAVQGLAPFFPGRKVLGLSARAILEGGGAFHCITQQLPL